jgi:serine/threonine protein kinase
VLSGAEPTLSELVLSECVDDLVGGAPLAIASIASGVIWGIADLPVEKPANESASMRRVEAHLPAWIPTRRTIGGFHVLKMLGSGPSHSVFLVARVEEKGDPEADRFALKVPEYSATAARVISEPEFTALFRSEAPTLRSLPPHANLAHIVTFDGDAKPKPILVMEFVEGPTLERLIAARALDAGRALRVLDDVLAGLEAMHALGIAHLDVKPANVVLRRPHEDAVLVDFGLAGRHLRPGCATGGYGAPEVWAARAPTERPTPADVYAFGCVAYEAFVGEPLFESADELAQIALHSAHDGQPAQVRALMDRPDSMALGEWLRSSLRRDPEKRATAKELRERLRALRPSLIGSKWPLTTT